MTTLNEKKTRRESLARCIRFESNRIEDYKRDVVTTKTYVYAGFSYNPDADTATFLRSGKAIDCCFIGGVPCLNPVGGVDYSESKRFPTFDTLPADVRSTLIGIRSSARYLDELTAAHDQLDAEIAKEENEELPPPPATISICGVDVATELPQTAEDRAISENIAAASRVEDVEAYSYAAALRSTLAERVEARERVHTAEPDILEDGTGCFVGDEAGAFADALNVLGVGYIEGAEGTTPAVYVENFAAVMAAVDKDIIDDINEALEEIDASTVDAISELAACFENDGRKAKAAGYRQVAQLAALYAINDAIESQPELEDLLSALFAWSNPAQLPENIAAGVADALATAREVFNLSLLSPDDLGERTRAYDIANWSMENKFFRGMDDDFVSAFCVKPACGVWISFFNDIWVFERSSGVTDVTRGVYTSEHDAFVETLSRYLGPDAEDLY